MPPPQVDVTPLTFATVNPPELGVITYKLVSFDNLLRLALAAHYVLSIDTTTASFTAANGVAY